MDLLKNLCNLRAVSGNESAAADFIYDMFLPISDSVYKDKVGNVVAKINNGANFTVLVEAHMDEIGLIVSDIDDNGFIKFTSVGGINSAILPGKEVVIHGKHDILGVIGAKPPHLMAAEEREKKLEFDSLFIDVGFSKEKLCQYVKIGDVISFKGEFVNLCNNNFVSKSIDNRAGIYVILKVFEKLYKQKLNFNITAIAAVQEELGCLGAKTGVFDLTPDYAIVVDVTHGQSNYINKYKGFKLGDGPTVAVGPNFSNSYNEKLLEFCDNNAIKHTIEVCEGHSGTDAWPIQISQNGIPCSLVSIPLKHMHSDVELAKFDDVDGTIDIICRFLKEGLVC